MIRDFDYKNNKLPTYDFNQKPKFRFRFNFNFNFKFDKEKILFIILVIVAIICVILTIMNIRKSIKSYKVYKQYEAQTIMLKQQAEEKAKEEQEKKEKERQAKLPKLTDEGKENIKHIYSSDTKRAFLTFDDGPSAVTNKILDTLKQQNIKATFFVLGSNVEAMPDLVKRMYDEGHFIANHGYSHVYSQIYSSPESVLNEYNQCNDAVKKAIGENDYNSHLFRFPGGLAGGKYADIKTQANELLEKNDIVHVDWNALNGDAETNNLTTDLELSRLNETVGEKNSIVVLMHDSPAKSVTADSLSQIIDFLKNKGYEFKSFYEIIK